MGNIFGFYKNGTQNDYTESFFLEQGKILDTTDLDNNDKILFRRRFSNKLYNLRRFKHIYAVWFYIHRFLASTLGVGIPALLSIQYYYNNSVDNPIYWTAWGLSILGGLVTGYNNIFKVDQRYYLLRNIYQKMKNEGWCFILLCKKYDQKNNQGKLKHKALFVIFMESVEDIINDYHKNDMEAVMEDTKKNENFMAEIQQRALGLSNGEPSNNQSVVIPTNQIQQAQKDNLIAQQILQQQILEQLNSGIKNPR